jgi:hypothetical protein
MRTGDYDEDREPYLQNAGFYQDSALHLAGDGHAASVVRWNNQFPGTDLSSARNGKLYRYGLIVTHRLGSVNLTDRIMVMKAGKLVEQGTHAELIAHNGEYARLYQSQEQWYRNCRQAAIQSIWVYIIGIFWGCAY